MSPRDVVEVVRAVRTDEGTGKLVRRAFPQERLRMIDPFVLFDDYGPLRNDEDRYGFHPHRGFVAVTLLLEGEVEHTDTFGHQQIVGTGAVQWMSAGRGVIHQERPIPDEDGRLRLVQIWQNLPASAKWSDPFYLLRTADDMPLVDTEGARVKVVAGTFEGEVCEPMGQVPVVAYLVDLSVGGRAVIPVPDAMAGFLYVLDGEVVVGGSTLGAAEVGVLAHIGSEVRVVANSAPAQVLVMAGEPIGEPVVMGGPFVMSNADEIADCFRDVEHGSLAAEPIGDTR